VCVLASNSEAPAEYQLNVGQLMQALKAHFDIPQLDAKGLSEFILAVAIKFFPQPSPAESVYRACHEVAEHHFDID
jgi:hypothetical protein